MGKQLIYVLISFLFIASGISAEQLSNSTETLLKNDADIQSPSTSKDERETLHKKQFETPLDSADKYQKVQVTISGLPEFVFPDTDYVLTCSVSWVSHKARFTWQVAPLGDERSGSSNFVTNTDGTSNYTSTISISFTKSDHGSHILCRIDLDYGISISTNTPKIRINLVAETSEKPTVHVDHTSRETNKPVELDGANEGDQAILTTTGNQLDRDRTKDDNTLVQTQESETVRPSIHPVKKKDIDNAGYISIILIITLVIAVGTLIVVAFCCVRQRNGEGFQLLPSD